MPTRRRLTRPESQAETKRHLLEAAEVVFAAQGFGAATVEQITSRAGYSRGAFYSNFKSKDELFLTLLEERLSQGIAEVSRIVDTANTTTEMIEQLRARAVSGRPGDLRWHLLVSEFHAYALRHPKIRVRLAEQERKERRALTQAVRHQFDAAGVPPPADPARLALLIQCVDHGLRLEQSIDAESVPPGSYIDFLSLLLDAAIALSKLQARSPKR